MINVLAWNCSAATSACEVAFSENNQSVLKRSIKVTKFKFEASFNKTPAFPVGKNLALKTIETIGAGAQPETRSHIEVPRWPTIFDDPGATGGAYYLSVANFNSFKNVFQRTLNELHSVYKDRMSKAEHDITVASDSADVEDLMDHQQGGYFMAEIAGAPSNIIAAIGRVHEGKSTNSPTDIVELPTEELLRVRGIKTEVLSTLRHQGYTLLELGKYHIRKDLLPEEKKILRLKIFEWILRDYLNLSPERLEKTIFVIDTVEPALARVYTSLYGAEIVAPNEFTPALDPTESVLLVSGKRLKENLSKIVEEATH